MVPHLPIEEPPHPVPTDRLPEWLGRSAVMQQVRQRLALVACRPWPVRLEGPRGVGKRVAAQILHALSNRAHRTLEVCYMNAVDDQLLASTLFGHVRGAFTGAVRDRPGLLATAHASSLLLDEIGRASLRLQVGLLQAVEEGTYRSVGEERLRYVDLRWIFATNQNLEALVEQGLFLADLLDRMGLLVVRIPPLAEHPDDIPGLVETLLQQAIAQGGAPYRDLEDADLTALLAYPWPGNVRELKNAVNHFVTFGAFPGEVYRKAVSGSWRDRLDDALERNRGNIRAVARELAKSPRTARGSGCPHDLPCGASRQSVL